MTLRATGRLDEPAAGRCEHGVLFVRGWVLGVRAPVLRVRAVANGAARPLWSHYPRPDVARAHPDAVGAELAGFEGWVEVRGPGPTRIVVVADLADGTTFDVGDVLVDPGHGSGIEQPRVLVWARSLDLGGSQLRMRDLVAALVRRGASVRVTAVDEGPLRAELEAAGAEVELRPAVPTTNVAAYEAGVAAAVDGQHGRQDVVLGCAGTEFAAVDVADALGIPSLLRVGESEPLGVVSQWLSAPWSAPIERRARRAFSLADTVVVNSAAAEDMFRSLGWRATYRVVRDGTDLESADRLVRSTPRRAARAQLGIDPNELLVLTPGTLWPIKGQAMLIDALADVTGRHPRVRLVLLGQQDAAYVRGLRIAVARHGLGDRVRIGAFEADPGLWYRAADVVAMPSVTESAPAVVLEAMAHRVPVLATCVGDVPGLVVEGETGWICQPADLADLTAALDRAVSSDHATRRRLGRDARRRLADEHDGVTSLARWCDLVVNTAAGRDAIERQ